MGRKAKTVKCLEKLFNKKYNSKFIEEFKKYMANRYAKGEITPQHPKTYKNYSVQINRIANFYSNDVNLKTGAPKQARGGAEAWEKYLKKDLDDFINFKINQELEGIAKKYNSPYYIPAGHFGGLLALDKEKEGELLSKFRNAYEHRAFFTDGMGAINHLASYVSDVPTTIMAFCDENGIDVRVARASDAPSLR